MSEFFPMGYQPSPFCKLSLFFTDRGWEVKKWMVAQLLLGDYRVRGDGRSVVGKAVIYRVDYFIGSTVYLTRIALADVVARDTSLYVEIKSDLDDHNFMAMAAFFESKHMENSYVVRYSKREPLTEKELEKAHVDLLISTIGSELEEKEFFKGKRYINIDTHG